MECIIQLSSWAGLSPTIVMVDVVGVAPVSSDSAGTLHTGSIAGNDSTRSPTCTSAPVGVAIRCAFCLGLGLIQTWGVEFANTIGPFWVEPNNPACLGVMLHSAGVSWMETAFVFIITLSRILTKCNALGWTRRSSFQLLWSKYRWFWRCCHLAVFWTLSPEHHPSLHLWGFHYQTTPISKSAPP